MGSFKKRQPESHSTENLAFIASAVINIFNHQWRNGGKIEEVIVTNKDAREKLFKSPEWLSVLDDLTLEKNESQVCFYQLL